MSGIQPDTVFLYTIRFDTYKAKAEAYNRICYIIKMKTQLILKLGLH